MLLVFFLYCNVAWLLFFLCHHIGAFLLPLLLSLLLLWLCTIRLLHTEILLNSSVQYPAIQEITTSTRQEYWMAIGKKEEKGGLNKSQKRVYTICIHCAIDSQQIQNQLNHTHLCDM